MITRSHFSVDLWFIFGSFCYGAEACLVGCHPDHLKLKICPPSPAALSEMQSFFDSINEKAKALVRTEVRLFVNTKPEQPSEDWADELVATLMTELKPRILSAESLGGTPAALHLELPDVRGLTPVDQDAWNNLVAEIWPQLPA